MPSVIGPLRPRVARSLHRTTSRESGAGGWAGRAPPSRSTVEEPRDVLQEIAEPAQGANITVIGGRLGQAEDLGGLAAGELLEMARISRWMGPMRLRTAWSWSCRSARTAAWLGVVSRPSNWAASDAELAWGHGPWWHHLAAGVAHGGEPRWRRCSWASRWPVTNRSQR